MNTRQQGKGAQGKRTLEGEVVSTAMQKTVVVQVRSRVLHPIYKKFYAKRTNYKVHDPQGACAKGDVVRIVECRPLSREKRWTLGEILTHKEE